MFIKTPLKAQNDYIFQKLGGAWPLWPHWLRLCLVIRYTGTHTGILVVNEKLILKHNIPQHRKDRNSSRKCTTNIIRGQNHNAEVVERSWRCFFPSQTYIYCFMCRLMCADTTKCAHFLIRKESATGRTQRSHKQSMEHKDATITFSRRCK